MLDEKRKAFEELQENSGCSLEEMEALWDQAEATPEEDRVDNVGSPLSSLTLTFIRLLVKDRYNKCVTYVCVNGCCSVLWHPVLGNFGGAGPAGCSCQDLEDPRDLEAGPFKD